MYRIAYAGQAEAVLRALPRRRRTQIDTAMRSTIARDPYGHGSTAPRPRERDYRRAAFSASSGAPRRPPSLDRVLTGPGGCVWLTGCWLIATEVKPMAAIFFEVSWTG
jgi:hypothetical protein